uniref:Immunoglobulin-like and fibronectin type III domain-containing protein 1 n=1 Tax=Xiphophorus maculatus TaxID=8083 RepID=A0A3B5QJW0_XIPMA
MITQFVERLPAGKSTPDFSRKPMTTNVQEGKKAFFKAMVSGEPPPAVTWTRNKGEMDDQEKYSTRYDKRAQEHVLEVNTKKKKKDFSDNYKCFATNEYGQAVCAVTLNVNYQSFKTIKPKGRYLLFSLFRTVATRKKQLPQQKEGEIDPKLLELLLSAPKKDYERICLEFGITDFRWFLKKLKQIKKEREDDINVFFFIFIAEFSFDMKLRDPNSEVNLYKDGTLIPYDDDKNSKHSLQKTGINYLFSIKDPQREDAGFYQVDVEETNVLTTDFQAKIKNSKVTENEDAVFQCVLSTALNKITWSKEDASLEHGGKYEITISEDKLTHTLRIKDCQMADKGAYYAIAGITSSSASLTVQEKDAQEKVEDGKEGRVGGEGGEDNGEGICDGTGKGNDGDENDEDAQFVRGLSDINAKVGDRAELSCKLNSETSEGRWYKNGKLLTEEEGVKIIKDGACHILMIECCKKDDNAVYRFEAEGRKSEATLNVQDPPRLDPDALGEFTNPVIVRVGDNAEWKLPFSGGAPMNIQWYKNDDDLLPAVNVKIDTSDTESQLRLTKCQRKDTGEVKIKIKNEFGVIEAVSRLIVLDKPTLPQGPVEITESAVTSVEFKWKPPKDSGGCPVTNYIIERQQVGRNKWSNLGEIPFIHSYKDTDVDPGRRYCYRIRAKNAEGISDYLQTGDIPAGYPGPPTAPKVASAFKDCINLSWCPPCDTGGTKIMGYNLEKNKTGTNYWSLVNQNGPITVKDIFEGAEYRFRVSAINLSGAGEPSIPCEAVIARDPKKPPGKVIDLKITSSSYTTLSLAWTKPKEVKGVEDEAQGYYVEIRPIESLEWTRCNATPIRLTSYTVLGLKAMAAYWVRVIATNYGGNGDPRGFDNYIIAMPPPVRPRFKDRNMKTLMVVKSGNTIRVNINFEASPMPDISWIKDGIPLLKHVTITNSDRGSQLLIPTSERSDSGIYMITVKNIVGQESFSVEIRVTDDPKPPGPVELDENIPGTVTLCWAPSPDEKRDDRIHYMVSKRDSFKRTWRTAADNLFNNKFTVVNIMPGREYYFRVFAKNDMGLSPPSESPVFMKALNFESPPSFIIPLKRRTAPEGYECYMSCAVKGDPGPRVTWYHNNISLNTNTNYHITNVCGVCSLLILRVAPKDNGEYKVIIENKLGNAESSMTLNIEPCILENNY